MSSLDLDSQRRADLAACRETLRAGSRTFLAASYALPAAVRDPAFALYAFCRMADDEVDLEGGGADALGRLRGRLDGIYARRPHPVPADRAFAEVVRHFAIPRALPDALLEGFAWDAEGRRYETLSDLTAYAVRVAGTVGAMMALLMGQREPLVVARACELGVAMQLTNIARDVGEDARAGRIYLPLQWLRESGIDAAAFMARPAFRGAVGSVVWRLLQAADLHYARTAAGIAELPPTCRTGVHAMRVLYAEIGREVERGGCDSVSRRAVVSPLRKALLLGKILTGAAVAPSHAVSTVPPIPQAKFLVEAVAAAHPPQAKHRDTEDLAWWDFDGRLIRLIELFDRLERREQAGRV